MTHNPERDAAAYLGGQMSTRASHRFEDHLLECEMCWREVDQGRFGRSAAESARELAPASLRENVRAAVAAAEPARRFSFSLAPWTVAAAAVVTIAVLGVSLIGRGPAQPAPIAAAISDFKTGRLPGAAAPHQTAPDLTRAGLSLEASGAGQVGGQAVDAFAYGDDAGHTLLVYLSSDEFPVAIGARHAYTGGPWMAEAAGVHLLCSSTPHSLLAVSKDGALLARVASEMGIGNLPPGA